MTAIQGPVATGTAVDLSRTLWRKQILKHGTIDYNGRKITFDKAYSTDLASAFRAGAYDQVPFLLATADNAHNMLPERYRGEVRGLIATDDGLDALLDLSDDGAEVVRNNPKLGVSARLVPGLEQADGRKFTVALQHVLGTLDPRIQKMRPWEAVELSSNTPVVDLTAATYESEAPVPLPELSEDQVARLLALLAAPTPAGAPGAAPAGIPAAAVTPGAAPAAVPAAPAPAAGTAELSDEEVDRILAGLVDPTAPALVPAGADLSTAAKTAIDLANAESAEAKAMAVKMRRELWDSRLAAETSLLLSKGFAPAVIDLAKPLLYGDGLQVDDPGVLELSNPAGGTDPLNVAAQVRRLLAEMGPQIDLTAERPYADPGAQDHEKVLLDRWEQMAPTGSSIYGKKGTN